MDLNLFSHINNLFDKVNKKLDDLKPAPRVSAPVRSTEIQELAIALAKAQSEMPVAELNKNNPYFKSSYADLQSIVKASRGPLTKNGLSITQQIIHGEDGSSWLFTTLWHISGQWILSRMRIVPTKNDIQTLSSHTTYLKRMAYAALIGVVTGDEDDDGEQAVATTRETFAKGTALNRKYNPKDNEIAVITKEQLEQLEYELQDHPDIAELVLDGLKINNLADVPKSKFQASITRVREIKIARDGARK